MKARMALTALLAAATLIGLACKTTIVGTEGQTLAQRTWMGSLTAQESVGIDAAYEAAQQAMTDLGLNIIERAKDALQAEIVARDAQDKKITVKLVSATKASTKLTIHAGSVEKDRRIYEAIRARLGGRMSGGM